MPKPHPLRDDYSDLQPLIPMTGPNAKSLGLLLGVLMGKIALPEFILAWTVMTPPPRPS